jgi:ABC-type Mn2+/Zn2+ transport system ATPase subunit
MPGLFSHLPLHSPEVPALELEHVSVSYDGLLPALIDVTVQIRRREQVAIVGPNGAGKSTFFNVIAGTVKPTGGEVRIYGSQPGGHICIGYVPQRNQIDRRFPVNVEDVVMMGRVGKIGFFRWPGRSDRQKVHEALDRVDMLQFAKRQIGELSGGQQQRVFLARALAQEAELLLMDEPFTGLDLPSQDALLQILQRLSEQGITILVATHDLNMAADRFPRMILLNRRVIADGSPDEVLTADALSQAYGGHLHVLPTASGTLMLTDTCCSGGAPIHAIGKPRVKGSEHTSKPKVKEQS